MDPSDNRIAPKEILIQANPRADHTPRRPTERPSGRGDGGEALGVQTPASARVMPNSLPTRKLQHGMCGKDRNGITWGERTHPKSSISGDLSTVWCNMARVRGRGGASESSVKITGNSKESFAREANPSSARRQKRSDHPSQVVPARAHDSNAGEAAHAPRSTLAAYGGAAAKHPLVFVSRCVEVFGLRPWAGLMWERNETLQRLSPRMEGPWDGFQGCVEMEGEGLISTNPNELSRKYRAESDPDDNYTMRVHIRCLHGVRTSGWHSESSALWGLPREMFAEGTPGRGWLLYWGQLCNGSRGAIAARTGQVACNLVGCTPVHGMSTLEEGNDGYNYLRSSTISPWQGHGEKMVYIREPAVREIIDLDDDDADAMAVADSLRAVEETKASLRAGLGISPRKKVKLYDTNYGVPISFKPSTSEWKRRKRRKNATGELSCAEGVGTAPLGGSGGPIQYSL
ncbi:hypothetical protein FB451DRAFT_1451528 [Mycena latifolia]|nr:hypothetical protein FB451DRAFT_1451528 [Mycena latifolia]